MTDESTPRPVPTWLRASELAKFFPVFGQTTWRKLIRTGELPSHKIGNARIVRTTDVDRFLGGDDCAPGGA